MITPNQASREYGLYQKGEDGTLINLATSIWHWGKFYEKIVDMTCKGADDTKGMKGKKAINYWLGMSAEVIDVICSGNIPHGTRRLVDFLKTSIRAGSFHPFDGIIDSQESVVQAHESDSLSQEEIITMNWLAQNVVGRLPEPEELTEETRALMEYQGVKNRKKKSMEEHTSEDSGISR